MEIQDTLGMIVIGAKPVTVPIRGGGWVTVVPRGRPAFVFTPALEGAPEAVNRTYVAAQLEKAAALDCNWLSYGLWHLRATMGAWKNPPYDALVSILTAPSHVSFHTGPTPVWERIWMTLQSLQSWVRHRRAPATPAEVPATFAGRATRARVGADERVSSQPRRSLTRVQPGTGEIVPVSPAGQPASGNGELHPVATEFAESGQEQ